MKTYPEAIALVAALIKKGTERGNTVVGAITLLTAEEREILFKLVASDGVAYTVEGMAAAATKFIILSPEDQK